MKQILFMVPKCRTCASVRKWLEDTDTLKYVDCEWVYTREGKVSKLAARYGVYDGPVLVALSGNGKIARHLGPRAITPGIVKKYAEMDK